MNGHDEPLDPKLFELVVEAVKEGLERVEVLRNENKYIGTYFNWPDLSYFESGIPYLKEGYSSSSGPTDYKYAFRLGKDAPIDVHTLPSFRTLIGYVTSHPTLKDYFGFKEESDNPLPTTAVYLLAEYLIDRYIHIHGNTVFDREQLLPLYLPLEAALIKEKLGVNVMVPILFLLFDFDEIRFGPDFGIVRMDDDFQRARATKRTSRLGVHDIVLGAATHALVLNRYEVENGSYFRIFHAYSEETAYPLPLIDAFFTAIRIVTGHPTGYAQLLLEPIGWAHAYKAQLPPLEGTSARRYPAEFENLYWHRRVPTVTREEAVKIGETFTKLRNTLGVNQLRIASRRLNLCYLREDEEDAILDATIGLESLLVGGERNEITHKLALRMAALSTLDASSPRGAVEVFGDIKEIYKFRSAVAHGSSKSSQKREIAIREGEAIPIVTAAINYLRMALSILLNHPEYRDPARIDEVLLLGKLGSITDKSDPGHPHH
jgi:hypothetical protein